VGEDDARTSDTRIVRV